MSNVSINNRKGSSLAGTISFEKTNQEDIGRDYSFFGYIDNNGNKADVILNASSAVSVHLKK